jgi:hypothetical protein
VGGNTHGGGSSCSLPPALRQDSLTPTARLLRAVLGADHALSAMLAQAAEANLAPATRAAQQERERIRQVGGACKALA